MLLPSVYVIVLMTFLNLQHTSAANTKRSPDPALDAIQYPGPAKDVSPDADVPEACRGKKYCTIKPPDYPQEKFDKMFKDYKRPSMLNLQPALVTDPTLNNRQGDPDEIDQCLSMVTYEPLYKVRSKRGDWRTVVNTEAHDYVQKVRLETCINPGGTCFNKVFAKNGDYETFCKQKENTWEVVVDGKDGPEKIKTELPVCCSCHYKSVDLASRFGGKGKTSPAN